MAITVNRKPVHFDPDSKRVIARFFLPGGPERGERIIARIMSLDEEDALRTLNQTLRDFSDRHRNITRIFLKHFGRVQHLVRSAGFDPDALSKQYKLLFSELRSVVRAFHQEMGVEFPTEKYIKALVWLANSHYEVIFSLDTAISERVIFPIAATESNGIEDARFVRFTEDDGSVSYYATYTAYNGSAILPMLLETTDFYHFRFRPMFGRNARNKGMALFPRRINGRYAMLARLDGENNYIMFSDVVNLWDEPAQLLRQPVFPWEFVQLGNCGSPVETDRGWLLVTHGVGSVRRYCLGAAMLALDNPARVVGRLAEPILMPNEKEREGYVPNVVYSCGSIIHHHELVIPYAMSDYSSGFASIPWLSSLKKCNFQIAKHHKLNRNTHNDSGWSHNHSDDWYERVHQAPQAWSSCCC